MPETRSWEQLTDQERTVVIKTLTRLMIQAALASLRSGIFIQAAFSSSCGIMLPTRPLGSTGCLCLLLHQWSGFILAGGLATFVFLSRPNRVDLHYGSRVRLPTRQSHCWNPRSFGYMLNRQFTR